MKTPNYSYIKVTCCKTNSWKSGGRHLPVFQVFQDISISLTHKQTPPRQIFLILTQVMHQRFWMWFHDWQSHLQGNEVVPASVAASRLPRSQGSQGAGGVEDEGEDVVTKKITARVRNSHPRLYFHCSYEMLFSHIVSTLTSIFVDCILCAWSCAKF